MFLPGVLRLGGAVVVLGEPTSYKRDAIIQPIEATTHRVTRARLWRQPLESDAVRLKPATERKLTVCVTKMKVPRMLDRLIGAP